MEALDVRRNYSNLWNNPIRKLSLLDGIKSLSLFWVIFGHEFIIRGSVTSDRNLFTVITQDYLGLLIGNAFFAVDVFFFVGGLLTAYILL